MIVCADCGKLLVDLGGSLRRVTVRPAPDRARLRTIATTITADDWTDDERYVWTHLRALLDALEAAERARDQWKNAVIDAAVCRWVYTAEHETDPRKAINDVLAWESRVALDPAVSEPAAKLDREITTLRARLEAAERDAEATDDLLDASITRCDTLRAERDQLAADVREWLCVKCNTVYPGPPQPGFACVQCPRCGGDTGPRTVMELRVAEVRTNTLAAALREYGRHLHGVCAPVGLPGDEGYECRCGFDTALRPGGAGDRGRGVNRRGDK